MAALDPCSCSIYSSTTTPTTHIQGSSAAKKSDVEEFRKLYLASHYISLSSQARQAGLKELAAMQLTSMLRYVGIVPADRAFFEAGIAWKVRAQGELRGGGGA